MTSHDIVAGVRRLTRIKRVGHAGTLDPMATGVLLVCIGRATRISEYLMAGRKRYRAVARLGVSTDSHDADGQITGTAPVNISRTQIEAALSRFRGEITQVPPMVSALKRNGQPLYKLARRGITVERAPRPVHIYALALTDWSSPHLTLELTCSPGTYVRALARDLGQQLGCGAHLTELTRLSSGSFTLDQSVSWQQFQDAVAQGTWQEWIRPLDAGLQQFPACVLGKDTGRLVQHGKALQADQVNAPRDQLCRAYAMRETADSLIALLRFDPDADLWRPHKVFKPL